VTDLEHEGYAEVAAALERFQVDFLAATRSVWRPDFPIPPDALGHFSRQWEYPYAWANLSRGRGRLLDAGSGLTFLPFLFAAAGLDVMCCDPDGEALGYSDRFEEAARLTGLPVGFTRCTLEEPPFRDAAFDAVVCVSVLEHVRPPRDAVLASLARIIAPGGRVVLTCDVDLRAPGDLPLEDLGALLAAFERHFVPVFPVDLRRPPSLLTSERFLAAEQWRLPPVVAVAGRFAARAVPLAGDPRPHGHPASGPPLEPDALGDCQPTRTTKNAIATYWQPRATSVSAWKSS
jgi:SAM-dependent methyltransferase